MLQRSAHFKDYKLALAFALKVNAVNSQMDLYANMPFSHKCLDGVDGVDGVDVDLEFFTFEANYFTDKEKEATRKVNTILESKKNQNDQFYL